MLNEELLKWNRRGLIPGPDETENGYLERCRKAIPLCNEHSILAKELFDIELDWIEVSYSNKHLRFWEGACVWLEGNKVSLQLRKAFKEKKTYLGFYSKGEILAHECLHLARQAFEEPIFEEILAYQTSSSFFQRYFGPFFRSSRESFSFFVLTFLSAIFTFFYPLSYVSVLFFMGLGSVRLMRKQSIFRRAKKNVEELAGARNTLPIMVRLSDREIHRFSKMKATEILFYAQKMAKTQLRWKQILLAYFNVY